MQDLTYILSLGFTGDDLPRALIVAFFLAMIFGGKRSIWILGLFALLIDRAALPVLEQAASGGGISAALEQASTLIGTFFDYLGVYVVRYIGLVVMIGLFIEARKRLHQLAPTPKKAHA